MDVDSLKQDVRYMVRALRRDAGFFAAAVLIIGLGIGANTAIFERAVSPRRFLMMLLGAFAFAALLLASIGIYGVVSYSDKQREQEIGIRMALGASAGQVQRHVMTRTVALVSAGIAIGVLDALVLARLTASLLYHLEPADPLTFVSTVAVLLFVALAAGYLPALRASLVEPMSTLRAE